MYKSARIALLAVFAAPFAGGCGGGNGPVPASVMPAASATAPVISAFAPFSVETIAPMTVSSGSAAAAFAAPQITGRFSFAAVSSSVTAGLSLGLTVTNLPLAGFPVVRAHARAVRATAPSFPISMVLAVQLVFSSNVVATGGLLVVDMPPGVVVAGASYYAAFFDPYATPRGWRRAWSGPATVAGTQLTFALPGPLSFAGRATYGIDLFAISAASDVSAPLPPPPSPLTASPESARIAASGNVTVTANEPGYSGAMTVSNSCGGRIPIAAVAPVSGSGPSFAAAITALNAGVCLLTFADVSGNSATIVVAVTSNGFTVQTLRKGT